MPLRHIDIDTPQPNGHLGEPTRSANVKHNANITETEARLVALEDGTAGVGERLDNEITARVAADSALGARITQETANRTNADSAIIARLFGDNYILNASMDVWRRGKQLGWGENRRFATDRWIVWTGGGKQAATARRNMWDTNWPESQEGVRPEFALYVETSIGGTANDSFVLLQQCVEGVTTLSGQDVVASFGIWANKAKKIAVGFWQNYDDGNDVTVIPPVTVQLQAGWQIVQATRKLPKASITRVHGPRAHIALNIWLNAGDGTSSGAPGIGNEAMAFWITNVKLEAGTTATAFRPRPVALEHSLCERYFQSSFPTADGPVARSQTALHRPGVAFAGSGIRTAVSLPTLMRATPNITFYDSAEIPEGQPNRWGYYDAARQSWLQSQGMNLVNAFATGFIVDVGNAGLQPGYAYLVAGQYTADAEF